MSNQQAKESNTSLYSYYINDSYYSERMNELSVWDTDLDLEDPKTEKHCTKLIIKECRLLDEYRFDEFSLYIPRNLSIGSR